MNQEKLLSIEDMCQYFGIGRNKAYELIQSDKIKAFKAGRSWRIPQQSINDYIQNELNKQPTLEK